MISRSLSPWVCVGAQNHVLRLRDALNTDATIVCGLMGLSGSTSLGKGIPFSKVNDNFCDCEDGYVLDDVLV